MAKTVGMGAKQPETAENKEIAKLKKENAALKKELAALKKEQESSKGGKRMIYADFSYYKDTYCGEMAEGDFKRLSRSASAYLDSITFDRIPSVTEEKIKERVKEACCAGADVLLQKEQRDGIASETNDGISVTYTTEGSTDEQRLYRAAVLYLSNTGLLYRGVE